MVAWKGKGKGRGNVGMFNLSGQTFRLRQGVDRQWKNEAMDMLGVNTANGRGHPRVLSFTTQMHRIKASFDACIIP